jgi:hypothetical protein
MHTHLANQPPLAMAIALQCQFAVCDHGWESALFVTQIGGLLGSSALTTYVESAAAVKEGGRTGAHAYGIMSHSHMHGPLKIRAAAHVCVRRRIA